MDLTVLSFLVVQALAQVPATLAAVPDRASTPAAPVVLARLRRLREPAMSGAVTPRVPPSPRCAADCPDAGLRAVPDACDPARRHFLATTLAATVAAFLAALAADGGIARVDGGGFECPNHGARFDAQGRWTGGQRASDLAEYGVTLDALAGTLTVG